MFSDSGFWWPKLLKSNLSNWTVKKTCKLNGPQKWTIPKLKSGRSKKAETERFFVVWPSNIIHKRSLSCPTVNFDANGRFRSNWLDALVQASSDCEPGLLARGVHRLVRSSIRRFLPPCARTTRPPQMCRAARSVPFGILFLSFLSQLIGRSIRSRSLWLDCFSCTMDN